ncbi:hypothetical protein CR513_25252, partial [Mucuna pruriens]
MKTTLDQYLVKGSIAMIKDEPPSQHEWVSFQDGSTILMCEDPSQLDKLVEDEHIEAEALVEMEIWIGEEKPTFQPLVEELEAINLGDETERKEVQVGKHMPPDLRLSLVGLLKEYADSYRDMLGLDCGIVEHKLPLLLDSVPIQQ